jgi:hypothetical protein
MNPTLILCIASIVVEAALAVLELMNKGSSGICVVDPLDGQSL